MTHTGTQIYSLYEREPLVLIRPHKPPIEFKTKLDVKNEYQNEFLAFLKFFCYTSSSIRFHVPQRASF